MLRFPPRKGQYDAQRQDVHRNRTRVEIPKVAVVHSAQGNGLRRVDHAATADGEHHVHLFLPAQLDSLVHQRVPRIGLYAAKLHPGDAGLLHRFLNLIQQPAPNDRTAAVMQQRLFSVCAAKLARLELCSFAECKLSRADK